MTRILALLLALLAGPAAAQTAVTSNGSSTPGHPVTWGNAQGSSVVDTPVLGANVGGTGNSALTANSLLVGNGTSPVQVITPSSAGQILIDQGPGVNPLLRPVSGGFTITSGGVATISTGTFGTPGTLYGSLGSFYTTTNDADGNANARIHAFRDRVFVDDGVLCSGVAGANPNFCWSSTRSGTAINNIQWGWVGNGSSLLAVNSWGGFAITGYSIASNAARSGNPYPPSSTSATIGVAGMALNDYSTTPFATWAGYFETLRAVTGAGTAIAVEIDAGNTGPVIDMDPYTAFQGTGGWTLGHAVGCGGSAVGPTYTNCSNGIAIAANGAKWRKGISFMASGLDTSQGLGGGGLAMALATGMDIQWYYGAGTVGMDITSTNNTTATGSLLNFNGGGATFSNGGAQFAPQWTLINTHAGTDNAYFVTQKQHGTGVAIANGDSVGTFLVQGFANAAYQSAGSLSWTAGTPSGSNVPSTLQLATSTSGGQLNNILQFDLNAHVKITQATAPTLTAGCNGAGSSITGSDFDGNVTGQTAAATTCTVTFGTAFTSTPSCTATGDQSAILTQTRATGTLVVTFASTANYRFNWHCGGA